MIKLSCPGEVSIIIKGYGIRLAWWKWLDAQAQIYINGTMYGVVIVLFCGEHLKKFYFTRSSR